MAGCGAGGVGREGQGEGEEPRRLVGSQRTEKWCGLDRRSAELFIDIIKHANNKDTNLCRQPPHRHANSHTKFKPAGSLH